MTLTLTLARPRRAQQVEQVTRLVAEEATPYVGEALRRLRAEVGGEAAVLGFVGAPFTLASYIVEGGSSAKYTHIKRLAFSAPDVLHALLGKLADNIADYVRFQACASRPTLNLPYFRRALPGAPRAGPAAARRKGANRLAPRCSVATLHGHKGRVPHVIAARHVSGVGCVQAWPVQVRGAGRRAGEAEAARVLVTSPSDRRRGGRAQADAGAQAVQMFDSWASELAPQDFDVFAGPYIARVVDSVRASHPDLALILYISGSGGLMERMAALGVDVISVDHRVDLRDALGRIGPDLAVQVPAPRWELLTYPDTDMQGVLGHMDPGPAPRMT